MDLGIRCLKPGSLCLLLLMSLLGSQEVGDGTTSVVIIASELLKRAHELVAQGIHPTSIISGYRLAMREVRLLARIHLFHCFLPSLAH